MSNVVSLSGGKDSTALLLIMLERGERIEDVVFFDGGWEFPQMYEHIEKLEHFTGLKITRLRPRLPVGTTTDKDPLTWLFSESRIKKRGTDYVHHIGKGWPHPNIRWCTSLKIEAIKAHINGMTYKQDVSLPLYNCVGFAIDESHRTFGKAKQSSTYITQRFPLIEWGVTEAQALKLCQNYGFHWGGLYEHFSRVSCFCCPLKPMSDIKKIRKYYPDLWQRMRNMDAMLPNDIPYAKKFKGRRIADLEREFQEKESLLRFL